MLHLLTRVCGCAADETLGRGVGSNLMNEKTSTDTLRENKETLETVIQEVLVKMQWQSHDLVLLYDSVGRYCCDCVDLTCAHFRHCQI